MHFHEFFREFHAVYARHRRERDACDLAVAELLGDALGGDSLPLDINRTLSRLRLLDRSS